MTNPPELPGAEHHWIDAGGLRVHYAEAGDPETEPLLLLHGWPQHHAMWGPVIAPLAERFRLIAPDLRGFGWSEAPGHDYDGETFARDQVSLLDALGIERANVLGHDWGAWTAFLLGLDHGERIERIVACNVPPPWPARDDPRPLLDLWRLWYVALNALAPARQLKRWSARWILTHGHVYDPFDAADVALYTDQFGEPPGAKLTGELYRYYFRILGQGLRGAWNQKRLAAPTLLLFGMRDLYVSPKSVDRPRDYSAHADDLTIEPVPDSGHFIVDEKPDLVARRALEHLTTTERNSVGAA